MNVELARRVKARILARPDAVTMYTFVAEIMGGSDYHSKHFPHLTTCGTVGCIAGHVVMEVDGDKADDETAEDRAMELLDIPGVEADLLFFFDNPLSGDDGSYSRFKEEIGPLDPGTPEYAAVVAEAIEFCIERFESGKFDDVPRR